MSARTIQTGLERLLSFARENIFFQFKLFSLVPSYFDCHVDPIEKDHSYEMFYAKKEMIRQNTQKGEKIKMLQQKTRKKHNRSCNKKLSGHKKLSFT